MLSLFFAHAACCKRNNYIILTYCISFTLISKAKIPKTLCKSVHLVEVLQQFIFYKNTFGICLELTSQLLVSELSICRRKTSSLPQADLSPLLIEINGSKMELSSAVLYHKKTLFSCADDVYVLLHATKTRDVFLHPLNAFMLSFNKR